MSTATSTIREQLEAKAAEMRAFADECDNRPGGSTAEDQARLITLAGEMRDIRKAYDASAAARGALNDTVSFLGTLGAYAAKAHVDTQVADVKAEAKKADRLDDGRRANPDGKTLGELFVESTQFGDFKSRYAGRDGVIPASTKGLNSQPFQPGLSMKALITGGSATSAGAAVRNDLYAPITDLIGERELTVADLVTKGSTESDTVEFVRVTSKTNAAAPVPEATTSATPGLGGVAVGAYDATHGVKPESALALEIVSTTVKTIAHWMPITKRAASDAGQIRTLVDNFLRYGLEEELEDQIISGSGAGENFTGILNTAGISTVGSAGTDLDAIVDAIRVVRVTGRRRPTALVIHPNDWYSTGFLLSKATDGTYLVGDPRASVDQLNTLWGLTVVTSEAITENTALVGDFRQAVLWEREGISISMTDSHNDFFVRNLLAILAEMRAAFGVLDAQAFCTVTAV
ncbi:MAG: phage major capsid protein [Chloroflexi bacterium]|nr:phage major capsid protein [Chloroflexota bacterium]